MEMREKVCLMRKNADKFNKKHYQGGMKNIKNDTSQYELQEK